MKLNKQIHIRASAEFKEELHNDAKSKNTTISSLLVDSYNKVKNENKKLQGILSNQ